MQNWTSVLRRSHTSFYGEHSTTQCDLHGGGNIKKADCPPSKIEESFRNSQFEVLLK